MPERQNENCIDRGIEPIQRNITGVAEPYKQFTQFGKFGQRPPHVRGRFQQLKMPGYGLAGALHRLRIVACEEVTAAFQASTSRFGHDYS